MNSPLNQIGPIALKISKRPPKLGNDDFLPRLDFSAFLIFSEMLLKFSKKNNVALFCTFFQFFIISLFQNLGTQNFRQNSLFPSQLLHVQSQLVPLLKHPLSMAWVE